MGGDGTINEVINGMVPVRSDSCFGFIPFGTVNDLARALHIPVHPRALYGCWSRQNAPLSM